MMSFDKEKLASELIEIAGKLNVFHPALSTRLWKIAAQVRKMERTLDEIVANAQEEARQPEQTKPNNGEKNDGPKSA